MHALAIHLALIVPLVMSLAFGDSTTAPRDSLSKKARQSSAGVILLHDWSEKAVAWKVVSRALEKRGYAVLVADLPKGPVSRMLKEAEKSYATLVAQGVDSSRVALIGEGTGANIALLYANRNEAIATVVLLSPGLGYRVPLSTKDMETLGDRPALLIASASDPVNDTAIMDARFLQEAAIGQSEFREALAGHGVSMLDDERLQWIFKWLEARLKKPGPR